MSQWVSHRSETALQESSETLVLGLLCFGAQRVECKKRLVDREHLIDQGGAVAIGTRHVADSLRKPLRSFEHRGEVILVQQLGAAVFEDFGVKTPPLELRLNRPKASLCLVQGLHGLRVPELSILAVLKT